MLPDLHTNFSRGRSGGLVFPSLLEFSTVYCDPHIISWSEKTSKKYVSKELAKEIRVKAEPFIKWLKEAEEESSGGEDDDEDENIEVVYSKTASVPKVEAVKSDNKDDDIDIDAI